MKPMKRARPRGETVFLLSPGHCGGRRARLLFRPEAAFPLAARLRASHATIGEVYTFISGLYFRGKLAYGRAFAQAREGGGVLVILPGHGLVPPETPVTLADLEVIAGIGVSPDEPRFRDPLARDAESLGRRLAARDRAVLLGSIATGKYADLLEPRLGPRLRFPAEFVGRGDLSRGGLLLRAVREGRELDYVRLAGAVRRGPRPPRLTPVRREARSAN